MTARTADLRLYLDYNPDPSKWAVVSTGQELNLTHVR